MKQRVMAIVGATVFSLGVAQSASAVTIVAGTAFDDNAFVDSLISAFPDYPGPGWSTGGCGGAVTVGILIGPSLADCVFNFTPGAFLEVGFTDNVVVNGPGDDIRIYELGIPDTIPLSLTLGGTTVSKLLTDTGFDSPAFNVNAANWDLSADFGLAPGATLSSLVLGMSTVGAGGAVPSVTVIGALNSAPIPEPGTLALLGLGLLGLGPMRRKLS